MSLNRLSTGSDYRMVRSTVLLNLRKERRKLIARHDKKSTAITDTEAYQRTIRENLRDTETMNIEDLNKTIVKSI